MMGSLAIQKIYADYGSDSENGSASVDSEMLRLIQSYDWAGTLRRIASHPHEAASLGIQGRTPLHVACGSDAPAVVIKVLLRAFPQASVMIGTSDMNPLHITCSSQHASVHVVQVLLEGGIGIEPSMRDVDGDTPLHTACRCGAPFDVLEVLLRADPSVVFERDYEHLTPLLRLWVRYFVIFGDDVIDAVRGPADLTGELGEAWSKTELLLRAAYFRLRDGFKVDRDEERGEGKTMGSFDPNDSIFRAVHTAAAVDCPRAVVKIATKIYPNQLEEKDEFGRLPLMIAAKAPIYKVHDLSDGGYGLEGIVYGDDDGSDEECNGNEQDVAATNRPQPSVIQILVEASSHSASVTDPDGRIPLHLAIKSGKRWLDGVSSIMKAYPDGLTIRDGDTGLYPFVSAAVGEDADLNTIFELLRADPSLLQENVSARNVASLRVSFRTCNRI